MTTDVKAPFDTSALLGNVNSRKEALLASGDIRKQDLEYVDSLSFDLVKSKLNVSDVALEKIRLMCQLWDIEIRPREIKSHRKFVGPIIVAVKKLIFPIIKVFLKDFIRQQKDFNAATVAAIGEIADSKSK